MARERINGEPARIDDVPKISGFVRPRCRVRDPRVADAHAALAKLRTGGNKVAPRNAEALLGEAVGPLLEMKGYALELRVTVNDIGIDFLARCPPTEELAGLTIGIELKHTRRPMQMNAVRQLIGSAMLTNVDRAVLVSSGGFSQTARQAVERSLPVRIELLSYDEIAAWIAALEAAPRETVDPIGVGNSRTPRL
jgi:hypothetical protein